MPTSLPGLLLSTENRKERRYFRKGKTCWERGCQHAYHKNVIDAHNSCEFDFETLSGWQFHVTILWLDMKTLSCDSLISHDKML